MYRSKTVGSLPTLPSAEHLPTDDIFAALMGEAADEAARAKPTAAKPGGTGNPLLVSTAGAQECTVPLEEHPHEIFITPHSEAEHRPLIDEWDDSINLFFPDERFRGVKTAWLTSQRLNYKHKPVTVELLEKKRSATPAGTLPFLLVTVKVDDGYVEAIAVPKSTLQHFFNRRYSGCEFVIYKDRYQCFIEPHFDRIPLTTWVVLLTNGIRRRSCELIDLSARFIKVTEEPAAHIACTKENMGRIFYNPEDQ